jgi:F0F1-type ATP synthase assembly protein I
MPPLIYFLKNMADNDLKKNSQIVWWQPAMIMFLKLSVWIAAPIIIALYLGKWLDKKYNSEPWLFLICIGVAFAISMIGLVTNTIKEFKKIDKK